ncbi:CBR-GUR-4 protein [Ditylenchus destructor]|uniref:CBR-GUR-4 protein n=1 Tax=Ditylenchus destructor TaxID=166010 RepID=A0AAD4N0M0_9BILA|nr:CBR-GUR-4 protein [Ditylenchus destructor]
MRLFYVVIGSVLIALFYVVWVSSQIVIQLWKRNIAQFFKATNEPMNARKNVNGIVFFCKNYSDLVKKVRKADQIFNGYILAMVAIWLPITIFAPISLAKIKLSFDLIFRVNDLFRCAYHLCGLCIIPAQVYTQLRATSAVLNYKVSKWIDIDKNSRDLVKVFADSVAQSNVGITMGGMTIIRSSMILTGHLRNLGPSAKSPWPRDENLRGTVGLGPGPARAGWPVAGPSRLTSVKWKLVARDGPLQTATVRLISVVALATTRHVRNTVENQKGGIRTANVMPTIVSASTKAENANSRLWTAAPQSAADFAVVWDTIREDVPGASAVRNSRTWTMTLKTIALSDLQSEPLEDPDKTQEAEKELVSVIMIVRETADNTIQEKHMK